MKLTKEAQLRARAFIYEQARPLEQRLFAYYFEGGTAADVWAALTEYQNPDGGFGHGLEPDIRLPDSSVIVTTVGLQTLRALAAAPDNPLAQGAIRYLLATYEAETEKWPIIPPNIDDAPHAPWWQVDGDLAKSKLNPRAEIVGYLFDYAALIPGDLAHHLVQAIVSYLNDLAETMNMFDLLCCQRLATTQALPADIRETIMRKLRQDVAATVVREPSGWQNYGLKPLEVAPSPQSPFAEMLAAEIDLNLDYEIAQQQAQGCWRPLWSWGDTFPNDWPTAEREWAGVLTVHMLKTLRDFGRLA